MKTLETAAELEALLAGIDYILLDCDGTVWNGMTLYDNVKEALALLSSRQIPHLFLSNNATASRKHYKEKFDKLGLDYVQENMIYTSGSASAEYLKDTLIPSLPEDCRDIYLIGQAGLEDELKEVGLDFTGGEADKEFLPAQDFSSIQPNPRIGVVLQGFDMFINLKKYSKAYTYLSQNPSCKLVLTNADRDVFTETAICPGEGALAAVLTSIKNPIIVGKPERNMLDILIAKKNLDRSRIIMIGDRLETDMLFAKNGGIQSLLVLTGSSTLKDAAKLPPKAQPDFVLDSLGSFAKLAKA